jgi:hypothetical protein
MKRLSRVQGQRFFRFLILAAAILTIVAFLLPAAGPSAEAGSGYSTVFYGVNTTMEDGSTVRSTSVGTCGWSGVRNGVGTTTSDAFIYTSLLVYQDAGDCALKTISLQRGQCSFDTSSLPDDCFISAATLQLYLISASANSFCASLTPRVVITPGQQQTGVPVVADYAANLDVALCTSVAFPSSSAPGYYTFTFNQNGLDYISKTGVTSLKVRDYIWDLLNQNPELNTDSDGGAFTITFKVVEDGANYKPKLTIYYGDNPVPRVPENPGNASVGGSGNSVTSIVWKTLRCAYADEELGFKVAGTAGTAIHLEILKEDSTILDEITDTIRTDGYFYWGASCSTGDEGFIRCTELNHSVNSEWGYVTSPPDASEIHNYTYATHTEYPQYDRPFIDYIVDETTPMIIHWKTDIQVSEQTSYSFRLYHLGDSGDTLFNHTLAWLCDNYYKNAYANNDKLAGVRYILFAGNLNGATSHDGLVIDLARPYISANKGFYQGLIYHDGTGEYSITHSAHCYLKDLPGIVIVTDKDNYDASTAVALTITTDADTGGSTMWDSYSVQNLRGTAEIAVQDAVTGTFSNSISVPDLISGSVIDDYTLRVTLYKAGSSGCTFDYTHDVTYSVGGGKKNEEEKDILKTLTDWLAGIGLGGATGKWLAIIIAMAIAFIITYKNKILRVLLPLLVFGFGIVSGMLDIWVVVLLALGAGVAIFFIVRRGFGGGGGEG